MKTTVRRVCLYVVGALYLATWVWGVPAVHTRILKDLIHNYKAALKRPCRDVGEHHPYMRFGASYVILPFVTVNHYEYQYAGLAGWGGFTVDLWYVTGTKTVFWLTEWVS